jgi:hypothetical protein
MPSISSAARRARAAADLPGLDQGPHQGHYPPDGYTGGLFANGEAANRQDIPQTPSRNASNNSSNTVSGGSNLGFEVRGYATDPKHSGYQILTNYESTYWRAFVGVQAWALYEVLRSFCHNGNNVCYPSINYLLEVLGIKQRRVLTGWSTEVKGKHYDYPGLIEILQNGGLIIAEVVGDGPMQRYLFHVNLTPDLLRPEQVAELPALLQSKHAEMLQAHFAEMAELASRRRPAKSAPQAPLESAEIAPQRSAESQPPRNKLQDKPRPTKNMVESEGMTNCQTPMTNCHTPSDNLSYKQHQYNNTQLTSARSTNIPNNNSSDLQQELLPDTLHDDAEGTDVVVALTNLGLAESVVKRLTTRFNRTRILQKIDYLAYLEEFHPSKVKNPRGWLRRAIEENYGAPDGYLTPEERAQRWSPNALDEEPAKRVRYSVFTDHEAMNTREEAQQNEIAEREYQRASRRELIRRQKAPDAATLAFWELVQTDVRLTMTPDYYRLIADSSVLSMDEGTVAIAIWDRELYRELLHPNRVKALARTISILAKRKLVLRCEYWDEEGQVVAPGKPPP